MKTRREWLLLALLIAVGGGALWLWTRPDPAHHPAPEEFAQPPAGALRVAWVGNSHTFVHQVPSQVIALGAAEGTPLWIRVAVAGGYTLEDHRKTQRLEALLSNTSFDVVVLQEASGRAHFDHESYRRDATYFSELVRQTGARVVLYENWSYGKSKRNPDLTDEGITRQQTETSAFVTELAVDLNATCAPVGQAFLVARTSTNLPRVVSKDGNHTAPAGGFLAAAVLYLAITNRTSFEGELPRSSQLKAEVRAELRRIAVRTSASVTCARKDSNNDDGRESFPNRSLAPSGQGNRQ